MGSSQDLDTAKADFKAAWENLKARIEGRTRGSLQGDEHSGRRLKHGLLPSNIGGRFSPGHKRDTRQTQP
jgi:hypothetical protein